LLLSSTHVVRLFDQLWEVVISVCFDLSKLVLIRTLGYRNPKGRYIFKLGKTIDRKTRRPLGYRISISVRIGLQARLRFSPEADLPQKGRIPIDGGLANGGLKNSTR